MIYGVANCRPVHRLHFSWTGWPAEGTTLPPLPPLDETSAAWNEDGMRLIARDARSSRVTLTFETQPSVTPVLVAQRAKGRLQHAWRRAGTPVPFSRKVGVRSLGHNVTDVVDGRYRIGDPDVLEGLQDKALRCARSTGLAIKSLAVMPDHMHLAVRGSPQVSPLQVGLLLQNATARASGTRLWQEAFYVGTFSAFDLHAVRYSLALA
jgi:REP element-mobilizing transposase RayT